MNDAPEVVDPVKPKSNMHICLYDALADKVEGLKVGSVVEVRVKIKVDSVEQRKDQYRKDVERSGRVSGDVQSVRFSTGNAYEELAEDD